MDIDLDREDDAVNSRTPQTLEETNERKRQKQNGRNPMPGRSQTKRRFHIVNFLKVKTKLKVSNLKLLTFRQNDKIIQPRRKVDENKFSKHKDFPIVLSPRENLKFIGAYEKQHMKPQSPERTSESQF